MKRTITVLSSALLSLALLTGCAGSPATGGAVSTSPSASGQSPAPMGSAPAETVPVETDVPAGILSRFTTTDMDGNEISQDIFSDYDITMVNIWATFCKPCLDEMPDLGELHAEYADKGFQIVGIVSDTLNQDGSISDSQVDLAQDIVESTGADYLHLLPSTDLYPLLSQATSVPTTLFVDKDGNQVGYAEIGSKSKDKWISAIDKVLDEVQK